MKSALSWQQSQRAIVDYAMAVLSVAAATVITWQLRRVVPTTPNFLFICAVMFSAWQGGLGPALFASVLGAATIAVWMPPSHSILTTGSEVLRFLNFLAAGVLVGWLFDRQRRAQMALQKTYDALEEKVKDRTKELSEANENLRQECGERKRAEDATRQSQKLLELVLATLPVGMAVTDRDGNIVLTNAASKRIWGDHIVQGRERWARSKGFWHDSGKPIAPEEWASVRALSKGETSLNEVIDIETYDEQKKTILNSCAPVRDEKGAIVGTVIVNQDVTERIRAEEALQQSEARLAEAQHVAHIGHWQRDIKSDKIICSEETLRIFGKTPGAGPVEFKEIKRVVHPDDRALQEEELDRAQREDSPYDVEYRLLLPGGQIRYVHSLGTVTRDASGTPALMFGTIQDITERKRAELFMEGQRQVFELIAANAALSESLTALIRVIEENAPGMFGSILLLNKQGSHLCHCAAPSLPEKYVAAIDGLPIGPCAGSCGTAAYTREAVIVKEIATDPRWENYRSFALPHGLHACWSSPIFDEQRRVLGTFAMYYHEPALPTLEQLRLIEIVTHIAAVAISRHNDQASLKESESKLKEAQRIAKMGYWDFDIKARSIIWSEETWRIFGLQPQSRTVTQEELAAMIHPDDREHRQQALRLLVEKHQPYDVEYRIVWPDGSVHFIHVMDAIVVDKSDRAIRAFGTVQDITERKQSEALLRAQEEEIKAIAEHSPDPIARYDRGFHRTYVNPAFVRAHGAPKAALLGKKFGSSVEEGIVAATDEEIESLRSSLQKVWVTGKPLDFEATWPSPSGRRCYDIHFEPEFDAQGEMNSVLSIARDITNLKEGQARLREIEAGLARAARVTVMGELTASIAHEVNQPLAAVVTNAQAASRWLDAMPPGLDEARKAVQRIARDGARASEVIRRIRELVKKGEPVRTALNLNDLIKETIGLSRSEITWRHVALQTDLPPELPPVPADRVQLQQVLLNLIINALDSMGAVVDRSRVLRITTGLRDAHSVVVSVQDNGVGIQPKHTERLYDPFFTTKPDGIGMGLAISRSIIESHGGRLWNEPNDGHGVTFRFTLPLLEGGAS